MAPWNLHERYLSLTNGKYFVNEEEELKFYHFSSFIADEIDLPQQHYDRFKLDDRIDLKEIYHQYNEELKSAGYSFYQQFKCSYSTIREAYHANLKKQKHSINHFFKKLFTKK